MEDNCSLPSLQDMLEDFDASRLEELAESLLADVITNLADDPVGDSQENAKTDGSTERVSRPVVGTRPVIVESSKNIDDSLNTPTKKRTHIKIEPKIDEDVSMDLENTNTNDDDDDTLYGTYDEKTHCITILVSGDDIATDEAVEEVYCDEDHSSEVSMLSPVPSHCSTSDHSSSQSLNDAIIDVKSPISISQSSDCGYESIGSPLSYCSDMDELWNSSFNQLFPSLV